MPKTIFKTPELYQSTVICQSHYISHKSFIDYKEIQLIGSHHTVYVAV